MVVDLEADHVRFPLDSEDVEVVGKAPVARKRIRSADTVRAGISRAVDGAVYEAWFLADVLHDVDFAAVGPPGFVDVVAQHPECGPDSLSARNLDAGLEAPIGLRKLALSFQ